MLSAIHDTRPKLTASSRPQHRRALRVCVSELLEVNADSGSQLYVKGVRMLFIFAETIWPFVKR